MLHHQNESTVLKDQVTSQQQGRQLLIRRPQARRSSQGLTVQEGIARPVFLEEGKGARFVTLFRDGIVFLLEVPGARPKVSEIDP